MTINETQDLIHKLIPEDAPDFEELRLFLNDLLDEKLHPPNSEIKIKIFNKLNWKSCSFKNKHLSKSFDKYVKEELIKTYPVPAYLASLGKITDKNIEKLARAWAAYNAQVLLGLANIQDQDDKYDLLSTRFRLAQTDESYFWLWQALPDLNLSLSDIALKLYKIENSHSDNESELASIIPRYGRTRILEIRKAYVTFLDTKPKIKINQPTRQPKTEQPNEAKRTSLQNDESAINADVIIPQLEDEIQGIDQREQRDDHQDALLVDNRNSPPKIARYSNGMQKKALRLQVRHIIRQKFLFPTDVKVLPIPASQQIFATLLGGFKRENVVDTCLLLSMLTVTNALEWIDIKSLIANKKIREDQGLQQYYRLFKIDISDLKTLEMLELKKNLKREFELPLPPGTIEILLKNESITHEHLQKRITELRRQLRLPSLTAEKIQFALKHLIKRHTSNHFIADLICDASPSHSPAIYYSSVAVNDITSEYAKAVRKLGEGIKNFDPTYIHYRGSDYCGSQQTPQLRLIKSYFKLIRSRVHQQTYHHEQFNEYSLYMWHLFLLLTSIRPVNHAPGNLDQINTKAGLIWISDKENRTTGSSGRFIPLCPFLIEAIDDYKKYLENFNFIYGSVDLTTNILIRDILSNKRPLLHLYKEKWLPITPSLVKSRMSKIFPLPLNWGRHFGRDYLSNTSKVPVYLIDSIFGHEPPDQEFLNPFSSTGINDLKKVANAYQEMAQELQLERMNIDVI